MNQDRNTPRAGTPRDRTVTLKVRTHLEQRIRAGFVFGREWRRVDVSEKVARQLEDDPELSMRDLDEDDDEIEVATHVGTPTNLQTPAPKGPAELAAAKRRTEAAIATREAEARAALDAKSKGTEPLSPPEGPKGGGERGDARKS